MATALPANPSAHQEVVGRCHAVAAQVCFNLVKTKLNGRKIRGVRREIEYLRSGLLDHRDERPAVVDSGVI
jgi:hypothetical protein